MTHRKSGRLARSLLAAALVAACARLAHAADPLDLMPEAASEVAREVDDLTYLILWVTGITFVGVQAVLVWFLFRYRAKPGVRAKYTHGNHTVELVWTVAPALILVFLALYQMNLWVEVKSVGPEDREGAVRVQIFAKQFEWNFRYPGPDGAFDTEDDLLLANNLIVPVDTVVMADLRSMDVIHSFYLPNFRTKQDALPGSTIPIWFESDKLSADREPLVDSRGRQVEVDYWDIVCAELCGNQHTSMQGALHVVSAEDYAKWLAGEATSVELPAPQRGFRKDDRATPEDEARTVLDRIWSRWSWQDAIAPAGPSEWHREPFGEDYRGEEEAEDEDF